jgi:hypothetical protein
MEQSLFYFLGQWSNHHCLHRTTNLTQVHETVAAELRIRQQGEPSLVPPAEVTPNGLYYLSNLDQNIAVIVQTVYCFRAAQDDGGAANNGSVCDVLRESLAKVLVPYYPLAGRLTISGEGKLVVDCTGEGAVFVEAEADCAMADIGDVSEPNPAVLGRLVYSVPGAKNILEMPLLGAQVRLCFFSKYSIMLVWARMSWCFFKHIVYWTLVVVNKFVELNMPLSWC